MPQDHKSIMLAHARLRSGFGGKSDDGVDRSTALDALPPGGSGLGLDRDADVVAEPGFIGRLNPPER
jgi:hypothetical protein